MRGGSNGAAGNGEAGGRGACAELTKTVEQATAKAREMDQELVAVRRQSEQRIAAADSARAEAEARLSEMRDSLQRAEQEKARIGADLARVQGELATAKEQVAAAGQEHAQVDQRAAALEDERDDLHIRLADATARLGRSEAVKAQLENEVAELARRAAAADCPPTTIEVRIKELNEALAAIAPAAGPLETDAALLAKPARPLRASKRTANGARPRRRPSVAMEARRRGRTKRPQRIGRGRPRIQRPEFELAAATSRVLRSSLIGDRSSDLLAHRAERATECSGCGRIVPGHGRRGDRRPAAAQELVAALPEHPPPGVENGVLVGVDVEARDVDLDLIVEPNRPVIAQGRSSSVDRNTWATPRDTAEPER